MSLNDPAFNPVSSRMLCLLSTKWLSLYPHLLSHVPESIENSHCWCFCEMLLMPLFPFTECLHNYVLHTISPRSWFLQLMTTSLVAWQTSIYSQCLPTLSHTLLHVFSSKVATLVLKQEQILQCICNCVPLIRKNGCAKVWVFKEFLNINPLTWETFSANYWLTIICSSENDGRISNPPT